MEAPGDPKDPSMSLEDVAAARNEALKRQGAALRGPRPGPPVSLARCCRA
jgi:hypothetical protein